MDLDSRLCTAESDPIQIGAILTNRRAFVASWASEHARDPQNTAQPGFCRHCGVSLGETEEDMVIPFGFFGFLPNVCCEPCSIAGKQRLEDEDRAEREKAFARVIPPAFLTWDDNKGNNRARAAAFDKFNISQRRGMVLYGTTGSCKTRIAWELMKKVFEQPERFTWSWLDGFEISKTGFPKEASQVNYLVIDDLGNEPKGFKTEMRWETELLFLLRKRFDWHRPTIITTQLSPTQFKERFFNGVAAAAVMRRMRENTDSIGTDSP